MKTNVYILFIGIALTVSSCDFFHKEEEREPVARVNNTYLYRDEISAIVPGQVSAEDSALIVNNYINHWATEQLLLDQARLNLPEKRQQEFERLVKDYRKELYIQAYTDIIISKKIDTTVNEEALKSYFEANKTNFKLNQDLVKLRYIHLQENYPRLDKIKEKFKRFNEEDKLDLERESLKFNAMALNDSVWISARSIYEKIGPLSSENKDELLNKDKFLQLRDSLGVYLVHVTDVLRRNEDAPLEYVKPTIKQILLNKQKLELSKELEKDITKDALKNEKFEIYN